MTFFAQTENSAPPFRPRTISRRRRRSPAKGLNHSRDGGPPKTAFIPSHRTRLSHVGFSFFSLSISCAGQRETFGYKPTLYFLCGDCGVENNSNNIFFVSSFILIFICSKKQLSPSHRYRWSESECQTSQRWRWETAALLNTGISGAWRPQVERNHCTLHNTEKNTHSNTHFSDTRNKKWWRNFLKDIGISVHFTHYFLKQILWCNCNHNLVLYRYIDALYYLMFTLCTFDLIQYEVEMWDYLPFHWTLTQVKKWKPLRQSACREIEAMYIWK